MLEVQVGPVGEACDLARDPGTESVFGKSPEVSPKEPVRLNKPLVKPVRKEPQLIEGDPSGEPDRTNKGRAVD